MSGKLSGGIRYVVFLSVATALLLLLFEGGLRLCFGLPKGLFNFRPTDNSGLYLPDQTLHMVMGPVPYTVTTNSLGFRGPDISLEKPAGVTRIAALGDSVTDGFYVDNEATYPHQLQEVLQGQNIRAEVVNAARGGASIDIEYAILRKFVLPLKPDMVVLAFVANDIDDLRGTTKAQVLSADTSFFAPEAAASASETLLLARTALGELILDASLRMRYENYRRFEGGMSPSELAARYQIPGGSDTPANLEVFLRQHVARNDSVLQYSQWKPEHRQALENYWAVLEAMRKHLASLGIRFLLVYTPGYNEIHDPNAPTLLRDSIRSGCAQRSVGFLDCTGAFQEAAEKEVLDLAPLDFHFNPAGNRVLAQAVGGFLLREGWLKPLSRAEHTQGTSP